MTRKKSPARQKTLDKRQLSFEEVMKSLKRVGDDVKQIVKLTSDEKFLVNELFASLKQAPQQMFSIPVSQSTLPTGAGAFTQAHIDSGGHLILSSEDGLLEVMDLRETRNRDLMLAVVGDLVPKFKDFTPQPREETLQKPLPLKEMPPPEPVLSVPVQEELTAELPTVPVPEAAEEVPLELPLSEVESIPEAVPAVSADQKARIEEAAAETLRGLETLGDEVFTQSPVSVYFGDWLVNLRQVISGLESSGVVTVDDAFTDECEQTFRDIEEELANRLLKEAELEASVKTLAEKMHVLGQLDAEYTAQAAYLTVRSKSAMNFLVKNVQWLEDELARLQQIKTLNPIKLILKEQKRFGVTLKLKAAKKRLALAMQNSAGEKETVEAANTECSVQARSLAVEEENPTDSLVKNVKRLEDELAQLQQVKSLNPLKAIAKEQKMAEVTEKLNTAKQKLALAAQSSEVEQKRIRDEYEKKKQTTIKNVENLEKEIATKKTDNSLDARKAATDALARAVKALVQRNTEPTENKQGA